MTKAIVFGAGGWLGERLMERLAGSGRDVIGVDLRLSEDARALPGVTAVGADIRDIARYEPLLQDCPVVFNCAGVLHPKQTRTIYEINRDAPVNLFAACMRNNVRSFVHISSINAQGANPSPTTFLTEDLPLQPFTHYGLSKAEGDRQMQESMREGCTRLILLRPGVFYGERPSKNLRELMDKLRTSRLPYFSERGFLRTYVDVEKVVDALVLGEHHGRSGEAYLIGDEEPMPTRRFYEVLADELGVPAKTIRMPAALANACEHVAFRAGKADKHLRLPTIVGEFGRNVFCSVEKARRDLQFLPHHSAEEGLRRMVRSVGVPNA